MDITHRYGSHLSDPEKDLIVARPGRVFVAEDDAEMRAILRFALTRRGYEVTEAENGAQALELLGEILLGLGRRHMAPDLVITDQCMPGCEGLDLIEALREVGVRAPAILITAFGDPDLVRRATEVGATAVLDKPFDVSLLLAVARRLLAEGPPPREVGSRG